MEARKETSGDSCCRALEYHVLLSEGGRILSMTDTTEGGAAREAESPAVSKVETGSETTCVAKVTAEIHLEERRGSRDAGKRAQKL